MRDKCDKCSSEVLNGKCSCGVWVEHKQKPPLAKAFELTIEAYNFHCDQTNEYSPISGDHHSGTCFVFFKGNYQDIRKVREFIDRMNNVR